MAAVETNETERNGSRSRMSVMIEMHVHNVQS